MLVHQRVKPKLRWTTPTPQHGHGATAPRRQGPGPHSAIHRHKDAPSGHQDFHACTWSQRLLIWDVAKWFLPDFIHHTDHMFIYYIYIHIYIYLYICLNKCVLMYFGRFGNKSIILSCNQDRYGTIKTDCSSTSQLHGRQAWRHRKSAPHSPPWQSKAQKTYETGKAGSVTHRIIPSNSR